MILYSKGRYLPKRNILLNRIIRMGDIVQSLPCMIRGGYVSNLPASFPYPSRIRQEMSRRGLKNI
jgi:hypothetical protein